MNIYVGNLDFKTTEDEVKTLFEQHGQVESVQIIKDKYSGDSKGFGFVVMPNDAEAKTAMETLDGQLMSGRNIKVNESRPRREGGGGGGGGRRPNRY